MTLIKGLIGYFKLIMLLFPIVNLVLNSFDADSQSIDIFSVAILHFFNQTLQSFLSSLNIDIFLPIDLENLVIFLLD